MTEPQPSPEGGPSLSTRLELLARLRADQQQRWLRGERVLAEEYRRRAPELRADAEVFLDLVFSEVLLRRKLGEAPTLEEYARRFPDFERDLREQLPHVVEVFDETAPAPPEENDPGQRTQSLQPTEGTGTGAVPPPAFPRVAGFEVLAELGRGGMGVVYKARDSGLKRLVAVKQLNLAAGASAELLARFRAEAEAIARLHHPHIVQVYQWGEQDGRPFLVLEFVPGGSLDKKLQPGVPQPVNDSARLVLLLARAVHAAHQRGIVHRDLKPGNVLLAAPADEPALNTPWGCPKVTDFGLARLCDAEGGSVAGAVIGTPEYMAPEQAEGRVGEVGPAADVWALGVILYEVLTGRRPFQGSSVLGTLRLVCEHEPEPVRAVRPEVPEALAAVVTRCLRKRAEERYPSAAALADELKRVLDGEPIPVRPSRRWSWRRAAVWLGAGSVAAVVVAVVLFALLHPGGGGISTEPGTAPLEGVLSVQVWTEDRKKKGFKVEEEGSGALPVRNGDEVQLLATVSRPAHVYLVWIDAEGDATALYPWNDEDPNEIPLTRPPPERPPVRQVRCPKREGKGFPVRGKSGLVTALLLARREPLPASVDLADILARLKGKWEKAPSPGLMEVVVRGFDRGELNEAVSLNRNRGLQTAVDIDDTVLQLRDRLGEHFELIRSVSFAQVAGP
jgi:serine/threonine protein kinase